MELVLSALVEDLRDRESRLLGRFITLPLKRRKEVSASEISRGEDKKVIAWQQYRSSLPFLPEELQEAVHAG